MREKLLPALPALLVALTTPTATAQTALQLRWELVGDVIANDQAVSRAAFTLTNRDAKDTGYPLGDYVAVPIERTPQGAGRDPRLVTPQDQFARSSLVRGPIPLRGTVRVAAFSTTGRKGHTARLIAP
jgi:hypothetical protein